MKLLTPILLRVQRLKWLVGAISRSQEVIMQVTKVCKMCGVEFMGNTNACYCGARCRMDYTSAYHKSWRNANREHYREYQKKYQRTYGK